LSKVTGGGGSALPYPRFDNGFAVGVGTCPKPAIATVRILSAFFYRDAFVVGVDLCPMFIQFKAGYFQISEMPIVPVFAGLPCFPDNAQNSALADLKRAVNRINRHPLAKCGQH
jgi:hypothetical protein